MWPNPQDTADLVTFTKEIRHGKLHFLCCDQNEFQAPARNTFGNSSVNIKLSNEPI